MYAQVLMAGHQTIFYQTYHRVCSLWGLMWTSLEFQLEHYKILQLSSHYLNKGHWLQVGEEHKIQHLIIKMTEYTQQNFWRWRQELLIRTVTMSLNKNLEIFMMLIWINKSVLVEKRVSIIFRFFSFIPIISSQKTCQKIYRSFPEIITE